jgi:ABC-type multidrug transport system ATPase subunit
MSENILRALMRLFAIIAKSDSEEATISGLEVVRNFLKQQLNQEQVEEYIIFYQQFLKEHKKKSISLNSVKVLRICNEINGELMQRQKVIVLIRLIEYINSNNQLTPQEVEFVETVSSSFNIPDDEFRLLVTFINATEENISKIPEILLIADKENAAFNQRKLICEGLKGKISVAPINSVSLFLTRYFGSSELNLNGQNINNNKAHVLTQGSTIRGNKISPIFYSDIISKFMNENRSETIVFEAQDIEFEFKGGKKGLHNLRFSEESGTLIGIMGGSGAGKSTILNVLNGNEKPSTGKVTINGIDIHHEKEKIEGVIGYVSQDDLLIEELTVFQNLFYNAKLCFDQFSDEKITQVVMDLLLSLGMQETAHLKVGDPLKKTISGGQRKRLNIALELIREPAVLFVDEPTSGLSSKDSEVVMDLLKELALKGKLVFVVIHQPSSDIFKMFDKLLILDLGGYPIYYGNPVESLIYFKSLVNHVNANESECIVCGNVNPEQVFSIIETRVLDEYGNSTTFRKISPKEWNKFYYEKLRPEKYAKTNYTKIPNSTFKVPNKLKQFKVFITRDVLSKLTNLQYVAVNALETPILALVLALLVRFFNTDVSNITGYKFSENENIPAYILMGVVIALFVGLSVSAEEIIRDKRILKRESFLNLSRGSYIWSKIAVMFLISAIQTATFVLIGNSLLGIRDMYIDYWIVLFSASCFANILGLNISASFDKAVTIYILIPFLIIPQLLLSGVIVKFEKLNPIFTSQTTVPPIGELMASRWAYEALAVNQFKTNKYQKPLYEMERIMSEADYRKTYWIPKLIQKIDEAQIFSGSTNPTEKKQVADDLELVKNELKRNNTLVPLKFTDFELLEPSSFDASKSAKIKAFLNDKLLAFYKKKFNFTNNKRDEYVASVTKNPEERERFNLIKEKYENENLSSLLRNKDDFNKIIETEGRLIQRSDPIFHNADRDLFLRAHFFAPTKSIFSVLVDTFWVNVSIIWLMTVILIVTLYFESLKKFLDFFGRINFSGLTKLFKSSNKVVATPIKTKIKKVALAE